MGNSSKNESKSCPTETGGPSESTVQNGTILDDTLFTIQVDLPLHCSKSFHHRHHRLHHFHPPRTPSFTSRKVSGLNTRSVVLDCTPKSRTCQMISSSPGPRTARN